jgi:hypothetical protein
MTDISLPAPAPTRQNAEETFTSNDLQGDLSHLLLVRLLASRAVSLIPRRTEKSSTSFRMPSCSRSIDSKRERHEVPLQVLSPLKPRTWI